MADGAPELERVDVKGLRIAHRRRGSGPALVLLHGGMSDSREWRAQLDQLSDEFTVVAWDAPGCGGSSDPPPEFRLPDYADCLAGFVVRLGLGRPHVVGLSFGAGLALELARRHRGIPRSLVLASAYAGWAGSLPPDEVEERLRSALADLELPPRELAERWLPGLLTDSVAPETAHELIEIMSDVHADGARVMARSFAEADLRDVLSRIDVPTLLLYGDADRRSGLAVAHELHAGIPGSRLVVIPGVGHQSNMEAPERFTEEVRAFLHSLPPAAAALHVDAHLPANRGVLAYLAPRAPGEPISRSPDDHRDPYLQAGSHPDVVERLWDRIGAALPGDPRSLVLGTPALVHPEAGVVMGVALGTSYALRVEADDFQEAVAAGAELVHEYTVPKGHVLDLPERFGSDWVFGSWDEREPGWAARAYHAWSRR